MIRLLIFPFIFGFSQTYGLTTKCKTHFTGVIDGKVGQIKMEEKTCKTANAGCVSLAYCRVRLADNKYEYGTASYCDGEAPPGIPNEFHKICPPVRQQTVEYNCRESNFLSTETGYEISYHRCCESCPNGNACNNATIAVKNPKCQHTSSTTFAPLPTTTTIVATTKSAPRIGVICVVLTFFSAVILS
ncbi:hypothetical protein AB6A40_003830 [Gnathostoma spinigerum]|uniref:Uncharacterized protein n=1 Tax=Gnathostoma spinigerum TaxID=75299 RepID=A0ABD6EBU3_9BILA